MTADADVSAIILVGGRSSRMGRDKAAVVFDGETLLQRTVRAAAEVASELILVAAPGQTLPDVAAAGSVTIVHDAIAGEGPLYGMATGLAAATRTHCLVLGVDMPFLQPALLRLLVARLRDAAQASGARWAVPVADRRPQPLCSVIARDALPVLRAHIETGDRAPMAAATDLSLVRIEESAWRDADPDGLSFVDIDTPEALEAAIRRVSDRPT